MYAAASGTGAAPAQPARRLSARDQHVWALFTDWCAATDQPSTPATPHQLARFLHDNPAAPATQRRRVSVINTVQRGQGYPAPGTDEAIRGALNTTRAARLQRVSALVAERLPQIPVTGWPAGLFGRRDGLILALAAAGVGLEQIARLRRRDITATADRSASLLLSVDGDRIDLPASPEIPIGAIYRGWTEVLGFLDQNHGTRTVAERFEAGRDLAGFDAAYRADDRPLLTSINRWGHTPLVPAPLTARAVTAITQAYLSGRPPAHTIPQRRFRPESAPTTCPIESDRALDPHYYERGIEARRSAHQDLTDVTTLLNDIEDRADQLLAELLGILDDVT
ncbi:MULTISPECIES: hypothetical protein [Rhodococcus]|uniref:hypothetical protein n=1 Tax=Rhodococcus TaxID=1827 RepID=UPI002955563A|nr:MULTISPECIES: hypothetical protein [Rhodococcus]MDV7246263.1 hypothetical protein [Rhodococcus oxybenzonivorans]MDV7337265.1 hypothetical protein [Rhodococcus oxybenzonivorans]MDV8030747.1 hypothetical protein [Rhodococcus sp. IEGM 27]